MKNSHFLEWAEQVTSCGNFRGIMQTVKSYSCAPLNEQVTFIKLKQAVHNKFVQLKQFEEPLKHYIRKPIETHRYIQRDLGLTEMFLHLAQCGLTTSQHTVLKY